MTEVLCFVTLQIKAASIVLENAMATQSVTAHLPVDLVRRIDEYAERLERSRGWIVKEALGEWVDREAERDRLTRQALESVDAGRLIDHERVEEWLNSLSSANPKPVPRP